MTKREIILTILESGAEITSKLFHLYGTMNYRESARRLGRLIDGKPYKTLDWATPFEDIQNFYSTLSYLKVEGFIQKEKKASFSWWKISNHGAKKLMQIRGKALASGDFSRCIARESLTIKVIIFDIPERDRNKRAWLRAALSSMGFSLLQKSVWIGTRGIPTEFFYELQKKKIFRYVHVFAISRNGSVRNLMEKKF